ncbi:hypothetical protein FACS1894129_1420 [Actinomycetota bacterium]|nr:hypothetical protein FACS1894129_1420 [Actinomycetota bacterium]
MNQEARQFDKPVQEHTQLVPGSVVEDRDTVAYLHHLSKVPKAFGKVEKDGAG